MILRREMDKLKIVLKTHLQARDFTLGLKRKKAEQVEVDEEMNVLQENFVSDIDENLCSDHEEADTKTIHHNCNRVRSDVKCIICNKRHYAVLCSKLPLRSGLETESASVENSTTANSSSSNVLANQACTSEVLLQTLMVVLQNGNHKSLIAAGKLLTATMFYLKSGPVAIKTKLGWTLMGKTYRNKTKYDNNHFMNVTSMFVNDMCISEIDKKSRFCCEGGAGGVELSCFPPVSGLSCFPPVSGLSCFPPYAVPENHFHLGGHNYAVVSDFAYVARIHLRRYKLDATGSLLPTKDGIIVTPSVWLALVREFAAIDQVFDDGKVFVIKDCLLPSRTVIENVTYVIWQRYFQRKDFSRKFMTPVSMLKETEWNALKDIQKQITSKTVSIMFGRVFLKLLTKEVAKHNPFPKSDFDFIDAEIVLTTSMVELLCNHIQENVSSLFICYGCLEGYENQLGHT
ncbi:PC4 domain-containing protein [Trichonephila inaurata madagascariensis]|uniref:PC4 domain-containing protein n=1 Tax=Trichonephila inaurata madagascariensis TaxID=2747483 RepID=A0A8X6XML1_9ARAC|nr:PC4 domain-containing protein [Trichonephila inaurata madagascariensis]